MPVMIESEVQCSIVESNQEKIVKSLSVEAV